MLLIKAKGGLGNRMLSAASMILYANATNRQWRVDWTDGIYANKPHNAYLLLFQNKLQQPSIFDPLEHTFTSVVPSIWNNRLECSPTQLISQYFPKDHTNPLAYRKMSAPIVAKHDAKQLEVFWSHTSKFGRIRRFLSKEYQNRDAAISMTLKRYFQPCDSVTKQVDVLIGKTAGRTLGVHIRYTDLKVPIKKMLDTVERCMASGKYSTLFLATDSEYAQSLFMQKFDNVVTSDKVLSKENEQLHTLEASDSKLDNSCAALVDMMVLSKCDALVYCSRSTFSEASRLLGDFAKAQLFDLDRYNVKVWFKRFIREYL